MISCPKCGYQRQPEDDKFISPLECPKCRVIYNKGKVAVMSPQTFLKNREDNLLKGTARKRISTIKIIIISFSTLIILSVMAELVGVISILGPSKDKIAMTVKNSMQEKFNSDPQIKDWHLTIQDIQVLKKSGKQYQGIARITHEQTLHDVIIEITVDGDKILWQAPPGSFAFVFQKKMEELQKVFKK